MSMITEQIERLKKYAQILEDTSTNRVNADLMCVNAMREAADMVEELSAKLHASQMERSSQYYHGGWIPIKYHYITEEERQKENYPEDWVCYLDCKMPDDEQEILITTESGNVEKDVCYIDDDFYLDSGYDWIKDVIAWRPLPEPYSPNDEEADHEQMGTPQ